MYEDPDIEEVLSSQGQGNLEDLKIQRTSVSEELSELKKKVRSLNNEIKDDKRY